MSSKSVQYTTITAIRASKKLDISGAWDARFDRGINGLNALSVVVDLTEATLKKDKKKFASVLATASAVYLIMKSAAYFLGERAVPILGQILGLGLSLKDIHDAKCEHKTTRVWISQVESSFYSLASISCVVTAISPWNPLGLTAGAVAAAFGGTAITISAAKGVYDNWNTVKGWFDNHQRNILKKTEPRPSQNCAPALRCINGFKRAVHSLTEPRYQLPMKTRFEKSSPKISTRFDIVAKYG